MKKFLKGPGFILLLTVLVVVIALSISPSSKPKELKYAELLEKIEQDQIAEIVTINNNVYGIFVDSANAQSFPKKYDFQSYIPSTSQFASDMAIIASVKTGKDVESITSKDYNIIWTPQPEPEISIWVSLIPWLFIIGIMVVMFVVYMRQNNAGGNKVMGFSKSRAVRYDNTQKKVTFADVAGAEEEKQELAEIVDFLKDKKKFEELGARIPKGVLLVGPPGTGKTYLAKAVAGEAGVPFLSISGSDFVEMFVGVGASRVRDLFQQAKKLLPCIIFVDEIDAVGRQRGTGLGGGHDEREQTLNQLLVEMDGFNVNSGLIIIAATNRADILDPALTRPGRFDRTIYVNVPDVKAREKVLSIHSKNKPLEPDVKMEVLARMTPGFTPADLENIMNEAAILAARDNEKTISMVKIEEAIKRVEIGPEKKSKLVTERDRKLVAYHEAGHAIVARFSRYADPVAEISVVPRGPAGGYTLQLPEEDKSFISKSELLDKITVCMGGRVAEALTMSDISTGASNDILQATSIARRMVMEFGMSEDIGPINYDDSAHEIFIGRSFGETKSYSETTAARIDEEIKMIVSNSYKEAERILRENIGKLHEIAAVLIQKEKITGEEFKAFFAELVQEADEADFDTEEAVSAEAPVSDN